MGFQDSLILLEFVIMNNKLFKVIYRSQSYWVVDVNKFLALEKIKRVLKNGSH